MTNYRLKELIEKLQNGEVDAEEEAELDLWYKSLDFDKNAQLSDAGIDPDVLLNEFRSRYVGRAPVRKLGYRPLVIMKAAAVAGLILIGGALYFASNKARDHETQLVTELKPPAIVEPGRERAILILADGSKIDIDNTGKGIIATQGSVQVVKDANGHLRYETSNAIDSTAAYNTVITPRGGEYQLTLPDGTRVWLNASSSITFPGRFNGSERRVKMSGEVFYEVARNEKQPFIVTVNSQEVKVLGTHFNINAHADEGAERVTLLEGSVQVSNAVSQVLLKPGQQSHLRQEKFIVENADLEQVIAWKSGFFELDHSSLQSIMRAVSRWYDIDVVYEGMPSSTTEFGGRISKRVPLNNVLDVLRSYGIDCRQEGQKIIIRS